MDRNNDQNDNVDDRPDDDNDDAVTTPSSSSSSIFGKKFRMQLAIAEYRRRCRSRDKNKNNDKDDGDRSLPSSSDTDTDAELAVFLDQHRREIYGDGAHDIFGCARSNTGLCCHRYRSERLIGRSAVDVDTNDDGNNNDDEEDEEEENQVGFCLGAWRFLAKLCCGLLCGCNLQLFGMCAIAQEQRYLKEVLPSSTERPDLWQRDYITMQPWSEYYPAILRLRLSYQSNFCSHLKAMSTLSRRILTTAVTFVVFISLMVLLPVRFPRWQILILYGTILQPVVFLAFVHWMWNRFDLSLDAIVKYAACGFFICTSTTIFYELAASKIAQRIMILIGIVGSEGLKIYREYITGVVHITGAIHSHYIEPPIGYELTMAVIVHRSCRRYLERDPSIKIGRIVFPGWILHGYFDFALMAYSAINKIIVRHKVYHPSGTDGEGDDNDTSTPYLLYVMGIPFLGMLYFLYESWFQRERLDKLDRENRIAA
ncbi:hypothetical protein FRACYDRAFT_257625 [Fragilariopsis cylindrus CCMP1102]|uniref:Uncharacterized protein n=1 Tax=Fragilariopsis cylindrus CCMP1102 TaxID=635003 RepID=A0A1E7EJ21_9STRA|nr:hypothetical protein FRACYDRAFT_257625 [Fragilariopsis cylindrus CCMP1102]|eukprot:OEU05896.1 hypothetical protein FRACYDRAFT_257625 [Fragilariopsis cylindrus CCMP1102]